METVVRGELAGSPGILDAHALQYIPIAARSIELDQPDLVDGLDELRGTAIHDRHFGAVDLDQGIVDAEAAKSGEQMLDRRHGRAITITKHGTQRHAGYVPLIGSDLSAFAVAVGEKEA